MADYQPLAKQRKTKLKQTSKHKLSAQWTATFGGALLDKLPEDHLPTQSEVMRRYKCMKLQMGRTTSLNFFANELYNEIIVSWSKTTIPLISRSNCVRNILDLLKGWQSLEQKKASKSSYEKFALNNNKIVLMTYKDEESVLEIMKSSKDKSWKEEFTLFQHQKKEPPVGKILGQTDKAYSNRQVQKQIRADLQAKRVAKEKERLEMGMLRVADDSDDEDVISDSLIEKLEKDRDFLPAKHQVKDMDASATITLELPKRNLGKELAPLSARLHMSTRATFAFIAKMISLGKGNLKEVMISYKTVHRQRDIAERNLADNLRSKFKQSLAESNMIQIHFDGKLVTFNSGLKEDHLAIAFHKINSGERDMFAGAPIIPDGRGITMSAALLRYCDIYDITDKDRNVTIVGSVFDTTASNTGVENGCVTVFEAVFEEAFGWFACRRHVAELHISWGNDVVRGTSNVTHLNSIILIISNKSL